jgi:hypothetical protein
MVDRYTKAVLTVIAAALVVLAFKGFVGPLGAQGQDIQKVQICDSQGCASLVARFAKSGPTRMLGWSLATSTD